MIRPEDPPYEKAMTILQVSVSAFVHQQIPREDIFLALSDNLAGAIVSFCDNSTDAKAILYEMMERMENTIEGNYDGTLFDDDDLTQLN